MIEVHRLKGHVFWINHRHIETVEASPDTVVTLVNEKKYIVQETPEELAERIAEFERKIFHGRLSGTTDTIDGSESDGSE